MVDLRDRLIVAERNLEAARRKWHEHGEAVGSDESPATLTRLFGVETASAVTTFSEAHVAYYAVLREIAKLALDAGFVVSLPLSHDEVFTEDADARRAA